VPALRPYDTAVRAVVLDHMRQLALAEVEEPAGAGELMHVQACGLCGSDLEKLGAAPAGTVLGHEVVARTEEGRRVALVHHRPCGRCGRCLAGHESTCEEFAAGTILPGGFAERVRAVEGVDLPDAIDDVTGTFAEPLACVLRGAERVPRGRVLVVGHGFVGRLFASVLRRRGDEVFVRDVDPSRNGPPPDGAVDAAVLCAPGGAADAVASLEPGGTLLVFASGGPLDTDLIYRRELRVAGSRSATPSHLRRAVELLPTLDPVEADVLPLERFAEGLERYRSRRALKVVFTP
jgi:L-iditol 2-dehydrogenase